MATATKKMSLVEAQRRKLQAEAAAKAKAKAEGKTTKVSRVSWSDRFAGMTLDQLESATMDQLEAALQDILKLESVIGDLLYHEPTSDDDDGRNKKRDVFLKLVGPEGKALVDALADATGENAQVQSMWGPRQNVRHARRCWAAYMSKDEPEGNEPEEPEGDGDDD